MSNMNVHSPRPLYTQHGLYGNYPNRTLANYTDTPPPMSSLGAGAASGLGAGATGLGVGVGAGASSTPQHALPPLFGAGNVNVGVNVPQGHVGGLGGISLGGLGGVGGVGVGVGVGVPAGLGIGAQEEGKIYSLVIDLLDMNTREMALLELSKRREQYDELALVLWHSFGMCGIATHSFYRLLTPFPRQCRCHGCLATRNRLCVPTIITTKPNSACIK